MTMGGVLTFGWIGDSRVALVWGIPAVLLLTGLIGALNGIGVVLLRVPPFIMTLAMGIIVYGATLGITGGTPLGQASPALSALFTSEFLGVPLVIYIMAILAVLGTLLQLGTGFGRRLYAVGTNPAAAYIAGLPVRLLTLLAYAISGASAGLAGILMVGYAGGATLTMGQSYQLPSIAAVGGRRYLDPWRQRALSGSRRRRIAADHLFHGHLVARHRRGLANHHLRPGHPPRAAGAARGAVRLGRCG